MDDRVEHYAGLFEDAGDYYLDGLTVLVVRGTTVSEVVETLGAVPMAEVPAHEWESDELLWSTYQLVAIEGGVLAIEGSGYADPPNAVLQSLAVGGRASAVVRDNIKAHSRFGCAKDGELVFDCDEYVYLEDRSEVPDELCELFDLAWVDLQEDEFDPEVDDPTAVGLAMAEVITGLRLTAEDATRLQEDDATVVAVRTMQYAEEWDQARAID
ncbi:hypothetical protein NOCA1240461 [metagenome]|uniref:Uncharacterized protein n=1 Tax=metagenome TaxID=256318 RepID=A0A2P2CH74_9ZZZZ